MSYIKPEPQPKKVDCKNCKWNSNYGYCNSCHNIKKIRIAGNKYLGEKEGFERTGDWSRKKELNSEGNCPHYKRKWYKFWVK